MRKTIGVLILFTCLISGVLIFKFTTPSKPISSALFLPENVLFFTHQRDFLKYYKRFIKTSLGKTVLSFNVVELALDLGFPIDAVELLRDVQNLIMQEETDVLFKEFFSNDCSLALLNGSEITDYGDYLRENLVLFTEPIHNIQTLDIIINTTDSKYTIFTTQYGEHIIYRVQISAELVITFASVKGKTLFTINERTLRRMLDRYDSRGPNFTENYFFADFQKNNNQTTSFSYFEIAHLSEHIRNLFLGLNMLPDKSDFFSILKGFTAAIMSSSEVGNSVNNSIVLHYNENAIDSDILHFFHIPPEDDIHISASPQDTLLYFWMNTFDVRRLWDVFIERSNIDQVQLESIEENIALTAGLPFGKLLDLFGNRFHYILRKPSETDPVPLPNFTMIFELTDTEKAQLTLQQLFLLNKIPHGNDVYRDITFTYWGNEMQTGLQPVYSIHENYLYISSSVEMQLDVITTMLEGNGLISMYPFSSVGKPLLMKNNSSSFLKVKEFVDFLKDFLRLGEAMFSRQNREIEYQTKTFVYEIVFPLLESLKMYSSIASIGDFESGKINLEIYLNPADI